MRGHLQCRDNLAGNEGCPLKTGTTVVHRSNIIVRLKQVHIFFCNEQNIKDFEFFAFPL